MRAASVKYSPHTGSNASIIKNKNVQRMRIAYASREGVCTRNTREHTCDEKLDVVDHEGCE